MGNGQAGETPRRSDEGRIRSYRDLRVGRDSIGEYLQFLRISQGSLKELETHLILCTRVSLMTAVQAQSTLEHCDRLGKMLHRLIRSLQGS